MMKRVCLLIKLSSENINNDDGPLPVPPELPMVPGCPAGGLRLLAIFCASKMAAASGPYELYNDVKRRCRL